MADTKTEKTAADELAGAARGLSTDSPVHAPGTARILHAADSDGYDVLIAICDRHDDPDNPPPGAERHGQCGNCVFVKTYDKDLAKQLAALINAREPLASWLESAAWVAREHPQDPDYAGLPDMKFCTECHDEETTCVAFVDNALAVARVLNGTAS